ncbi:MAG: cyclase family protein [Candidatus Dependentiae bacterium]|nr:cyclase family protein [Candidatus Dependentiae bacterium]
MPMLIDLSHTVRHQTPVFPGDEPVVLEKTRALAADGYTDWRFCTGMHAGTHIDGPGHLTDSPGLLSDLPPERFVGPGYLVDARGRAIDQDLLVGMPQGVGQIVLVLTGWDKKFGSDAYFAEHPVLTEAFARELVRRKVLMLGIDFFSPDRVPFAIHRLLLGGGVLLVENLTNVDRLLAAEKFTIFALPIKTATDSAPARVVALLS